MDNNDLRAACQQLLALDQAISDQEQQLKHTKEIRRQLSEVTIPEMMEELGVQKMELTTGETISCKMEVTASIPPDQYPAAISWLEEHGLGDVIKTGVHLQYNRDERDAATQMAQYLTSLGCRVMLDEKVHPMTLKSVIKELLASGVDVPMDVFGAREYIKTVVKH